VGTVDSFQGREFDVVLLSTVRSNVDRVNLKRRVGFLSVRNRLCVALSRAKRLMVTVGDADTVAGTVEGQAVPELFQLLTLCRSQEGYYDHR
jgi:superfamily I DNA and/or RNA helicase